MEAAVMLMSDADDDVAGGSGSQVHKVETVPPPPGEDSAYDAPTKVGATAHAVLAAMKRASLDGTPLKPQSLPKGLGVEPAVPLADEDVAEVAEVSILPSGTVPKIQHEEDEELVFGATALMDPALAPKPTHAPKPAEVRAPSEPIPYPNNFRQNPTSSPLSELWLRPLPLVLLALTVGALFFFYLRHR